MVKVIPPEDAWVPELVDDNFQGGNVEAGKEVDAPAELAKRLVEQGWVSVRAQAAKKAARKAKADPDPDDKINDEPDTPAEIAEA